MWSWLNGDLAALRAAAAAKSALSSRNATSQHRNTIGVWEKGTLGAERVAMPWVVWGNALKRNALREPIRSPRTRWVRPLLFLRHVFRVFYKLAVTKPVGCSRAPLIEETFFFAVPSAFSLSFTSGPLTHEIPIIVLWPKENKTYATMFHIFRFWWYYLIAVLASDTLAQSQTVSCFGNRPGPVFSLSSICEVMRDQYGEDKTLTWAPGEVIL